MLVFGDGGGGGGRGGWIQGRNSASLLKAESGPPRATGACHPQMLCVPRTVSCRCKDHAYRMEGPVPSDRGRPRALGHVMGSPDAGTSLDRFQCRRWEGRRMCVSYELPGKPGLLACEPHWRSKNIRETITWIISLYPHQRALNIQHPYCTGRDTEAENS